MKKFVVVAVITLLVMGTASAQGWANNWGYSRNISVTGTLQLQNGTIAVVNGNDVYYVPVLERYIGFIEGLKEGTRVNVEGYIAGNGNVVQPIKMTIDGKSYDFAANSSMSNNAYGRSNVQYGGRGMGGYCGGWCW